MFKRVYKPSSCSAWILQHHFQGIDVSMNILDHQGSRKDVLTGLRNIGIINCYDHKSTE